VQSLAARGIVHPLCAEIFQLGKPEGRAKDLTLFTHQLQALTLARASQSYVVTTGTGSGKSLAFFLPIVDYLLKCRQTGTQRKTSAIVIYPMNALANSQREELEKFLHGYAAELRPFSVKPYTGQEDATYRKDIADMTVSPASSGARCVGTLWRLCWSCRSCRACSTGTPPDRVCGTCLAK